MAVLDVVLAALVRCLINIYTFLSLPLYFIMQKPWRSWSCSSAAASIQLDRSPDYVTCRNRMPLSQLHQEILAESDVNTLEKVMNLAVDRHGDRKALGTRELLAVEEEIQSDGRTLSKYSLGNYRWLTYREVAKQVMQFGRGLATLGVRERQNVVIFSETRAEWLMAAFGCFKQSLPVVTLYVNLNDEALVNAISETGVNCIVTSQSLVGRINSIVHQLPNVKMIIFFQDSITSVESDQVPDSIQLIPYKKVLEMGNLWKNGDCLPSAEDTAIIMYTSGSTGRPKGVILSHKNITSAMFGYLDEFQFGPQDVILAYLPLAHVLELIVETTVFLCGAAIGYSSPLTLTDRSSKVKQGHQGDATVLRPTVITSVPLINERLYKSIQENIDNRSQLIRSVFNYLINYKIYWTALGFATPILDKCVMRPKLASILGGRIERFYGGGAPLAPETHEFIRAVFCCPIYHGYGLTETTSSGCVMDSRDRSTGSVGIPTTCSVVKLVDWSSGAYLISDEPNPRGEIHIGGDIVAGGYYQQPELSAQEFYEEDGLRWFRSGDIGEIELVTGRLKIIDRKKDLVKNQYGEYIALSKVESVLKTCALIDNICVFADSRHFYVVGLVSPNEQHLRLAASKSGINEEDWRKLCADSVMEEAVREQIAQHSSVKNGHLRKFEIPHKVKIVPEVWTPESSLVTAGFKLKRKNIAEKYQMLIDQMYQD